eukprot:360102-Chlamydomonas_euryale.AAC.3
MQAVGSDLTCKGKEEYQKEGARKANLRSAKRPGSFASVDAGVVQKCGTRARMDGGCTQPPFTLSGVNRHPLNPKP